MQELSLRRSISRTVSRIAPWRLHNLTRRLAGLTGLPSTLDVERFAEVCVHAVVYHLSLISRHRLVVTKSKLCSQISTVERKYRSLQKPREHAAEPILGELQTTVYGNHYLVLFDVEQLVMTY